MRIDNKQIIGMRISHFRKSANMTQAQLSEKLEMSTAEISNLECGKNNLSYNTLIKLCSVLDICPCQLLSGAIKSKIDENIADLVRELSQEEQQALYVMLLAYYNNKNLK